MFNALKYTKSLEENGFEREQAEILVRMFMQMIEFNMVSKSDLERFRNTDFQSLRSDFEHFKTEVYHRFDKLEENLDHKINRLSLQLTVKLGVMLAISMGLISTLITLKL